MIDWQKDAIRNMIHLNLYARKRENHQVDNEADVETMKHNVALLVRMMTEKTAGQAPYAKKNDVDTKFLPTVTNMIVLAAVNLCLNGYFGEMPEKVPNVEEE